MFAPPLDIHRSKLAKNVVIVTKLGCTCKSMVFWTIVGNTCSIGFDWKGKLTRGQWRRTNLSSHMFLHDDNVKDQIFQKTLFCFIIVLVNICWAKKCGDLVDSDGVAFFFLGYWLWFVSNYFAATLIINFNFLFTTKWTCVTLMWVFMGVMSFVLLYLMNPLHKTKLWLIMLPTSWHGVGLQMMQCNIYGFLRSTRKLSLIANNPQHIEFMLSGFHFWVWTTIVTRWNLSFSTGSLSHYKWMF